MEVLIVAEQLRRAVPGGIGTYTTGLMRGLKDLGEAAPRVALVASRAPAAGRDAVAESGYPAHLSRLGHRALVRAWSAGVVGEPHAPEDGYDVLHAPSFAYPVRHRSPLCVVVHDVAWRAVPEAYTRRGLRWHESSLMATLKRASLIIVPSAATAADITKIADDSGIGLYRLEVVEWGVDHLDAEDAEGTDSFLSELGIKGDYFICVGTREPRKNLARLVAAYSVARTRLEDPWDLVIVGPAGWGPESVDEAADGVFCTGRVEGAVLSGLYRRARCAVHVPLVEGFGLPVVEAMSFGVPVIASPLPANGDAVLAVNPLDTGAIADALVTVATDESTRCELADAGLRRTASMSWETCARAHVELWREIA